MDLHIHPHLSILSSTPLTVWVSRILNSIYNFETRSSKWHWQIFKIMSTVSTVKKFNILTYPFVVDRICSVGYSELLQSRIRYYWRNIFRCPKKKFAQKSFLEKVQLNMNDTVSMILYWKKIMKEKSILIQEYIDSPDLGPGKSG